LPLNVPKLLVCDSVRGERGRQRGEVERVCVRMWEDGEEVIKGDRKRVCESVGGREKKE
jgi:hypothetical protein